MEYLKSVHENPQFFIILIVAIKVFGIFLKKIPDIIIASKLRSASPEVIKEITKLIRETNRENNSFYNKIIDWYKKLKGS